MYAQRPFVIPAHGTHFETLLDSKSRNTKTGVCIFRSTWRYVPALVNSSVGSFKGTTLDEGTVLLLGMSRVPKMAGNETDCRYDHGS